MSAMNRVASTKPAPGRRWYVVAGAIAVGSLLIASAVLVIGIRSWLGDFPKLGEHFQVDETARVDLVAGQSSVLYTSPEAPGAALNCSAELALASVAVTETPYTFTFFSGGRSWAARYELRPTLDGRAFVTCTSPTGAQPTLAVGDKPDNSRLLAKLAGTIALGGFTALLGLALGGTLAFYIRRRRKVPQPVRGGSGA
jgi:hypothetical protein